jgi:hypothetical protein
MYIELTREFYEESLLPELSPESNIREQATKSLRHKETEFDLNVVLIESDELDTIYNLAKDLDDRSLMVDIAKIRNLLSDLNSKTITSVKALSVGLIAYFSTDAIDGWLYHAEDGVANPFLIKSVKYFKGKSDNEDKQSVSVELVSNSARSSGKDSVYKRELHFDSDDIHGKTIPELLMSVGFFHETKQLRTLYNDNIALFDSYQPEFHKQFWIKGTGYENFDYQSDRFNMSRSKGVNDEDLVGRKFTTTADPSFWRRLDMPENFDVIPFHCYVYMFHLGVHKNVWVHVQDMEPYTYKPELRDKLILPQDHRDLIDILVSDMEILMEDIIEGKSGGKTILCTGTAGLGKTLTAEVYSEFVGKPLYRVHSGQLGLNAREVEQNLEKILKRSARWGAVLLIDEADVYIRARGNDLDQNAVVAAFLRTLEYFTGLLFMTTNRGDDVDDAIRSRCIAIIKYVTPTSENAKKIWKVLSTQFGVALSEDFILELVEKFPTASGRDIKELLKLTSRFAKGRNVPLSLETFRQCAQFRALA